nr:uncharacterized protein LOC113822305 [Penaeus vannamei]
MLVSINSLETDFIPNLSPKHGDDRLWPGTVEDVVGIVIASGGEDDHCGLRRERRRTHAPLNGYRIIHLENSSLWNEIRDYRSRALSRSLCLMLFILIRATRKACEKIKPLPLSVFKATTMKIQTRTMAIVLVMIMLLITPSSTFFYRKFFRPLRIRVHRPTSSAKSPHRFGPGPIGFRGRRSI